MTATRVQRAHPLRRLGEPQAPPGLGQQRPRRRVAGAERRSQRRQGHHQMPRRIPTEPLRTEFHRNLQPSRS